MTACEEHVADDAWSGEWIELRDPLNNRQLS